MSSASETVTVYQLTGQRQCVSGEGVPLETAADLLRGQGVKVTAAEQRPLPLEVAKHCGAPVPVANVITVSVPDWAAFTVKNRDAGGYGVWVFDAPAVEVYMYDGTLQCGMGEEIPLEQMADVLRAKGIRILESRKATDGLVHIAVCGASTGAINVFTIPREDLEIARELGFKLLISQEMTRRIQRPVGPVGETNSGQVRSAEPSQPIPLLW
jgi:hypothetical protein